MSNSSLLRFFSLNVLLLAFSFADAQQVQPRPLITSPINESQVVTLRGNVHPLARPMFDVGAAPPDLPMNRMMLVLRRDPMQDYVVQKLIDDQQDKNSPNYHKWLTPTEFGAQFGAADQDLQQITGWLQSQGFQVNRVSNGRTVIEFSGVESQVEQAFHTQIHQYVLPNGEQHWANASDPRIPAALVPAVAGVWSLHDFKKKSDLAIDGVPLSGSRRSAPLFTSNSGKHALMPGDFATIYNLNPLYSQGIYGYGATVAVVGRSNFNTGDVYTFWANANITAPALNVVLNGPDPGIFDVNEEFEAVLDATWSGSVARGANIKFVASASTNTTDGVDLSELYIIDNNLGDVMTESFGQCETSFTAAEAQALSALAQQAAAEGITYTVATGDNGAEGCVNPASKSANNAPVAVSMLASTPFNVAVGGTMFNDTSNPATYWNSTNGPGMTSAKSYIPENVWNESCGTCGLWAGSGGASTYFAKPNWQFGVSGIPSDGARDLPDISLTAAGHDPYLVCVSLPQGQCFYGVSGTSASTPAFAGIMALIVQQYGRQGAANYVLYRLAASETLSQCNASSTSGLPVSTCIFNDVTVGNNAVPGEPNYGTASAKYQAGVGYDLATGLGSVNANNLVAKWNTVTFNATTTTLGPSTISGTHGSPMTLNVAVSPSSGTGTPTGDVSLQTGLNFAANPAFVTLSSGAATVQVNDLPGGSYTLTARYGGDSSYSPSTSNGVQVNITPENSLTTASVFTITSNGMLAPFTSGQFGSFLYLYPRADVTGVSTNGTPSGTVQFLDHGHYLWSTTLNSQGNVLLGNGLGLNAGQYSLTASYLGDSSFNPSTSAPVAFTITQASTVLSLHTSATTGASGTAITLTANVSSSAFAGQANNAAFPSGTVTFTSGTAQIGSALIFPNTVTSSGVTSTGSFTTSSLPNGSNIITAQYSGNINYSGSSSQAISVNISPDFTLAPANSSTTVSQGGTTTEVLNITGQAGYTNTVAFTPNSCRGLPALTTCSFNPASVTGTGSTTVSIRTTGPSFASIRETGPNSIGIAAAGLLFAGVLFAGFPSRRWRTSFAFLIALSIGVLGCDACGGGSNNGGGSGSPGTPKGNYQISIVATTTDQAITHITTFTLVVQ